MTPSDPRHVLCTLLGVAPVDLAVPCQILKLSPYERNPAVIDQAARVCFARVQAAQHQVSPEDLQWMMQVVADARLAMLNAAGSGQPRAHFSPPAVPPQWPMPAAREPEIVIRTPVARRRSGLDMENVVGAMGSLLMCGALVLGVGMFIKLWWADVPRQPPKPPKPLVVEPPPHRPPVVPGGGPTTGEGKPKPSPVMQITDEQRAAARENLQQAIQMGRNGSFEEARRLAQRASRAMPDESEGVILMTEYVEQYSGLADAAQQALNGSSEVDLGGRWGKAQFVEQDADSITFFVSGQHKRFTQVEFKGIKGVRFRLTRDYLDRAANPANDLILGAYEVLMRVNESGLLNKPGSLDAAQRRFRKAIELGDSEVVESGSVMIKALDVVKEM